MVGFLELPENLEQMLLVFVRDPHTGVNDVYLQKAATILQR